MFSSSCPFSLIRRDLRFRRLPSRFTHSVMSTMTPESNHKVRDTDPHFKAQLALLQAVVRIPEDDENLTVTLTIDDRVRTLNRPKTETLSRALYRLRMRFFPVAKKGGKAQTELLAAENGNDYQLVALYTSASEESLVDENLSNEVAWKQGALLRAGNLRYEVLTNPPTITELLLNERPIVGHPVYPLCTFEFADEALCEWQWFIETRPGGEWAELPFNDRVFTPDSSHGGYCIGVQCTLVAHSNATSESPLTHGTPSFAKTRSVLPERQGSSGQGRHELTPHCLSSPAFRVVTYNVLADSYVSRPNAKSIFGYCKPAELDVNIRKQLVLKELLGYHADIICLQECDFKVYDSYYQHHLRVNGFDGFFTNKSGTTKEGEALFFRRSRFELVTSTCFHMNQILDSELPSYLQPFAEMISVSKNMREALKALVTVGQVALLRPVHSSEKPLCVINTHLISNAYGEHLRMLHIITMLTRAQELIAAHGLDAQILFVGDFNSSIDHETGKHDAGVTLLKDGRIERDHWEWEDCKKFSWTKMTPEDEVSKLYESADEGERDPVEGICLSLPFPVKSAMRLDTPYTNFTDSFRGLLDYVWYQPEFIEVQGVVPIPTPEQIGRPCPSAIYPSDHLAVVVDLRFKSGEDASEEQTPGTLLTAEISLLDRGVEDLKAGKVLGVPTDTLYGLAADAGNGEAVEALYGIKGRSVNVPLAVCVGKSEDIAAICHTEHLPANLLESILPGPITIVLERKETSRLSPVLNPELPTIGVRVPDSEFICQLCDRFTRPLALTSANRSGAPSSIRVTDFQDLWAECSIVYDGGEISNSTLGSTVVDLSIQSCYKILRPGDGLQALTETLSQFGLQSLE